MVSGITVAEAGRLGGQARARRISPERKRAIAQASRKGRIARERYGLSTRELRRQVLERIRERDPDLCWLMGIVLTAPPKFLQGLLNLLSNEAFLIVEAAAEQVVALAEGKDPQA